MARIVSRAESWERAYEAFQNINFTAFDYEAVKKSLLDYLKLFYPETFQDYIESSELVTLIETFAYVSELFAYRLDNNAHENFMSIAQRKESILRLAKLISYNAKRNIPARGLVKLTSISTSERVFDSRGNDLSNKVINWNDINNSYWKEQFLLVINSVLTQKFGTVLPDDRVQVEDILFELYSFENKPLESNVIRYNINVSGQSLPMELVSSQINEFGPTEKRPEKDLPLNVLYLSDGLGDSSENTGFFCLTKQGNIQRTVVDFDGVTPNQIYDIVVENCNETDLWVNNIDPVTLAIITDDTSTNKFRVGEWERVDVANAQNIIFNTNPNRNKYEVETLNNDAFRLIFGDGNFSKIPSGRFEIWYRVSANTDSVIPSSSIQNVGASFNYYDAQHKEQLFSFTVSSMSTIQNAAPTEDIEHIRRTAPAVYYTQDRMVNGKDYNEFMLQDNSIAKLRAINRTFAGDSKYIHWHDASNYYENVKIFGDDLVVYFRNEVIDKNIQFGELPQPDGGANVQLINSLIYNYIQPVLFTNDYYINAVLHGVNPYTVRKTFSAAEILSMQNLLLNVIQSSPQTLYLTYNLSTDVWDATLEEPNDWWISLESRTTSWNLSYVSKKLIAHSDETKFWINNRNEKVITYDTFNNNLDQIIILSANIGSDGKTLPRNYPINIISEDIINSGEEKGLSNIHDLVIVPGDVTGDDVPDLVSLDYLINIDKSYVYFSRECNNPTCPWIFRPITADVVQAWETDQISLNGGFWKREIGVEGINFLWLHRTPRYHLIDPSPSNIIDTFIITRGYYVLLKQWLNDRLSFQPTPPTPFELRSSYNYLLDNKMISDTIILHPGKIKVLFGNKAIPELQAKFQVIKSKSSNLTNNQIKSIIVGAINEFFDISVWEFGETFYFTELAHFIHSKLPADIDTVVPVPLYSSNRFGEMFQVIAAEDEILQPNVTVNDIEIVENINPRGIRQF